jgi:hypothetical protein
VLSKAQEFAKLLLEGEKDGVLGDTPRRRCGERLREAA